MTSLHYFCPMTTWAIEADGLTKSFRKGVYFETLRHQLTRRLRQALRPWRPAPRFDRRFLALDDVSFQLAQGQVMGLIGSNGSGKSTLLKLLSRITPPDRGRAVVRGSLASLLEVGTGFHPELTGRENIFLNGAILGLRRAQVRQRLEAIVEFAEVGDHLDTPVKFYSSGMYVRLAFSVAAHIEPDVLILDEVLAVGDAAFQRRCLGKMEEAATSGRTVVLVSHNLSVVSRLCTQALLLERGRAVAFGPASAVVERYLHGAGAAPSSDVRWDPPRSDYGIVYLHRARLTDRTGRPLLLVSREQGCRIEVIYEVREGGQNPGPAVELVSAQGEVICTLRPPAEAVQRLRGFVRAVVEVPPHVLRAGLYRVAVGLRRTVAPHGWFVRIDNALLIEAVEDPDEDTPESPALLRPDWPWLIETVATP